MKKDFQISCESTIDLPSEYVKSRNIEYLPYTYVIDGEEFVDNLDVKPQEIQNLYAKQKQGKRSLTSQITAEKYEEYFEKLLQKHNNVLHVAFGSGMTPSVKNAEKVAKALKAKYPEKRIVVVDSLCSSSGYGMLVDVAVDMWESGKNLDEIAKHLAKLATKIHHQFFCTRLTEFKKSGRVSNASYLVGALLNICPIMRLNREGQIVAYGRALGRKRAIAETVREVMKNIEHGKNYEGKLFICHSNCLELAAQTRDELLKNLHKIKPEDVKICQIGGVISSHCGEGTVAVFFVGKERE